MYKNFIGIDSGLNGAIAALIGLNNPVVFDTPTLEIQTKVKLKSGKYKVKREYSDTNMAAILHGLTEGCNPRETMILLEKVHAMPGQGVASMFSMGAGYGLWRGIIASSGYPLTLVTPQEWKKATMSGMGKEKDASVFRAQQLYPLLKLTTERGRALDGRGDAIMIAHYGMITYGGD